MATKKKALKKSKLRHAEYYDFQEIQDKLYAESMDGKVFTKLVEIITLPENIKLAYRNIKKNKGSNTQKCVSVNVSGNVSPRFIATIMKQG